MNELTGILFYAIFLLNGQAVSRLVFHKKRPAIRLWLGTVIGQVLITILPALWAFGFGFTRTAQYMALLTLLPIGAVTIVLIRKKQIIPLDSSWKEEKSLLTLLPLFAVGIYLFYTHTLLEIDGGLYVGQSTFGDLAMHVGFVTSLTEQGFFPPQYSILPGTPIGYPFLCDSISATFHVLGGSLRFSMLLPAIIAYGLVLVGVYFFFENWLKDPKASVLASWLFFVGGGLGFAYFFDLLSGNPENLTRIFTDFYTTPTNYAEKGMLWVNPIADMLIPQRATLFGWSLLFPALFLLRSAVFEGEKENFLPLAALAGCMPLVHTHSFLALGILSAFYLLTDLWGGMDREKCKGWLMYGGIVLLLAFPQLFAFTFRQSEGFLRWHLNWANATDNYFWFYLKNLGLFFLLLPVSFLNLDKKERRFYFGSLLLWAVAETIQFQPNTYDNNKLLFVWFAFTCGITSLVLGKLYRSLKDIKGRRWIAAAVLALFFTSGLLTLGREAVSRYQLFSPSEVRAAQYIRENTEPDAYFLTATNHNNLVATLSGRNIHCGSSVYVYFIGLDYRQREAEVTKLYTDSAEHFPRLAEQFGIDYVLFTSYEREIPGCDEVYFQQMYPVFYHDADVTIYKIT